MYVRRKPRVRLEAQMHGGGHERGLRSGTLPTHQMHRHGRGLPHRQGKRWPPSMSRIQALHDNAWCKGLSEIEQTFINGDLTRRVPHNLNISFNYVEGESLIMGVKGLAVSSGSACTSASLEPSYVLRALGRSDELAHSSLRMTIGRFTTEDEIDYADRNAERACRQAARVVASVGHVQATASTFPPSSGRRTDRHATHNQEHTPWHTATRSSTTTKTRATWAAFDKG